MFGKSRRPIVRNGRRSFAKSYCPSFFNNTVGTLRQILKIAVEAGARYANPASEIKKVKVRQKILKLPEHDQFPPLVQAAKDCRRRRFSHDCGDLIEFLAYSGARKSEAARVIGSDCDFANGRISIKGDPDTGTKNWEVRIIPVIPGHAAAVGTHSFRKSAKRNG